MNSFTKRSTRQQCTMLVASIAVLVPLTLGTAGPALADQVSESQVDDAAVDAGAAADDQADEESTDGVPTAPEEPAGPPASEPASEPAPEQPSAAPTPEPGAAPASVPLTPAPAAPADVEPEAEVAPRTDVSVEVSGGGIATISPGLAANVYVSLRQLAGPAVGAGTGTTTMDIDGPATMSTTTGPFSVSGGGTRKLTGCSASGLQTMSCSNGNPFEMASNSSTKYNNLRVPIVVNADALPGDVVTVVTSFSLRGDLVNTNPQQSATWVGTIPLTAATIATSGTVGATPTITGTGVRGGTVDVAVAGRAAITVPVADDGTWSLAVSDPLPEGPASIVATQHRNGATAIAATGSVQVDATAPAVPVVGEPGTWQDGTGTLTGTAEPGSTVVVRDQAGTEIGTATADPTTGAWSIVVTTPLPEGSNDLTVTASDEHGNESSAGTVTVVVPDTTAPAAPVIDEPGTWQDGTGTLVGTAEPGSTVVVTDADGSEIGRATADPATGAWSIVVTAPLPEGTNDLTVTASDADGNVSDAQTVTVEVPDTTAPEAPVVDEPGTWEDGTGTLVGTAEPGSTVEIRDGDGDVIGTVDADPVTGEWSFEITTPLPEGTNDLTIVATDADGNASDAQTVTVEVPDTTAPEAPVVDSGDVVEGGPITGSAEPGSTVEIRDAAGIVIDSAVADEDGRWSITPDRPLPVGSNAITITATDEAGNVSAVGSATIVVTAAEDEVEVGDGSGTGTGSATGTGTGTGDTLLTDVGGATPIAPVTSGAVPAAKQLAFTGTDGVGILALAAAALGTLGVLLRVRRRRG